MCEIIIEVTELLNKFLPNKQISSIYDLTPDDLREIGIKGLIIDLDNTLIPWNQTHASKKAKAWFKLFVASEIKLLIISNNSVDRVSTFAYPQNIHYIGRAKKPLPMSFSKACEDLNLERHEVAIIGDQLLTDILGGNMVGLYTILVDPLVESDAPITQFNRKIESLLLERFYSKGQLKRRQIDE